MHFSTLLCCVTSSTLFFVFPRHSRLMLGLTSVSVRNLPPCLGATSSILCRDSSFLWLSFPAGRREAHRVMLEVSCIYDCVNYQLHASAPFIIIIRQTARQFFADFISRFTACVVPAAGEETLRKVVPMPFLSKNIQIQSL
jgi:hypothetical protein